jgi:hypothetical protein
VTIIEMLKSGENQLKVYIIAGDTNIEAVSAKMYIIAGIPQRKMYYIAGTVVPFRPVIDRVAPVTRKYGPGA